MTSVSSPILDSSRPFDVYYACGGRNRIGCDPEWDRRYAEAKVLDRRRARQSLPGPLGVRLRQVLVRAAVRPELGPRRLGQVAVDAPVDGLVLFTEMDITN